MEARITFRSEIFIEGETLEEIHEKWLNMNLYSEEVKECACDYVDIESIENADNYEDLEREWNDIEDGVFEDDE